MEIDDFSDRGRNYHLYPALNAGFWLYIKPASYEVIVEATSPHRAS
jgi:hypothetical protein